MPSHIPLLGLTFGNWTVIGGPFNLHWECQCSCGAIHRVDGYTLRQGISTRCRSCAHKGDSHGLSKKSRAYASWSAMHHRCYDPTADGWENYGGRGIKVCERWHDFRNFFDDMGERPEGMEIDRIRNHEGYYPGNCRWATATENGRNKRTTVWVEHAGRTISLAELAELTGIHYETLRSRRARGTPLLQPVKQINHPRHR